MGIYICCVSFIPSLPLLAILGSASLPTAFATDFLCTYFENHTRTNIHVNYFNLFSSYIHSKNFIESESTSGAILARTGRYLNERKKYVLFHAFVCFSACSVSASLMRPLSLTLRYSPFFQSFQQFHGESNTFFFVSIGLFFIKQSIRPLFRKRRFSVAADTNMQAYIRISRCSECEHSARYIVNAS